MRKVLMLLAFCLLALQLCVFPFIANADYDAEISATVLPVDQITDTAATFNGKLTIQFPFGGPEMPALPPEEINSAVFQYGPSTGLYTHEVQATVVSTDISEGGQIQYIRARVQDLDPCSTYYVRIKWTVRLVSTFPQREEYSGTIAGAGIGIDSKSILKKYYGTATIDVISSNAVLFTTSGCQTYIGTGTHGAGGFNAVAPSPALNPSNILTQSAALAETKVSPGEKVDIAATVVNKGGSNGTARITLYVNGQEVESKGISLASGQAAPVVFSISRNDPGTYAVMVNGVSAGSFTVDTSADNTILIYSVLALFILGIIGVLFLVVKRRAA